MKRKKESECMANELEYPSIQTIEDLEARIAVVKAAQKEYAKFSQEQVDEIFRAAAMAANKARIPLAKEAVEETGMGIVEDKVIKNHYAAEYIYNQYRHTKTCGVIAEDKINGTRQIAEPIGLIAAVIPTTNPTSTAIFKCLVCLKTRNAILISPHPRAKRSTIDAAKIVLEAAVKAGAPKDIIGWIDFPQHELSHRLMREADCILATGGPGLVNAAYSSGTPALGVGAGNTPVIIDSSADLKLTVSSILHSKTFDNGMICASEQSVTVLADIYDAVKAEFQANGAYFLNEEERAKVGSTIIRNGALNARIVGQSAHTIAQMSGVEVPEKTKVLIAEVETTDFSEPFAHEKLSPVLAMYKAETFDEALDKAEALVMAGGPGHTSSLFINVDAEPEKVARHADRMKTCRIVINMPSSQGGIGDIYNFKLAPSLTLGCGSWGGNSISHNVGVMDLLNIKTVAERRENMLWFRTPEKIYFKRGCMGVALDELGTVMQKKRAFIVTGGFLYKSGAVRPIEEKLDELGIAHTVFSNVPPDPTLQCAEEGVKLMRKFEPDVIIALGGGSPMDAAKIMWVMYENPDAPFDDMAMDFMDIRKRIYTFPKMGKKAYMVAIPTSSGTGSEVTPFAIITDGRTGTKWPLADYELMPNMAIVDANNMLTQPKGLTCASGIDAMTHALEAYVSVMASDMTDGVALQATKLIFDYLPRAYKNLEKDPVAREHMAMASTLAGEAFANAFLGVNHSMAHKLGAYHHIPHGIANALILSYVMRYNANDNPTKMGTFPQYDHPHTRARYCEVARYNGITGADDNEVFDKFIDKIEQLKAEIEIPKSIRDFGIKEEDFLATLDEMTENAFNDQCTGANPRYPLMSEIKQLYLLAYYGEDIKKADLI